MAEYFIWQQLHLHVFTSMAFRVLGFDVHRELFEIILQVSTGRVKKNWAHTRAHTGYICICLQAI